MTKSKLVPCILMLSGVSFAAQYKPAIEINAVRNSAQKLTPSEKTITCKDAVGHANVITLCQTLRHLVGPDQVQVWFAVYVLQQQDQLVDKSAVASFLSSAAESRIDTQNGAPSSTPGTTSVVERSAISDVLGAALESGAVTQSVSGSTLTLQGNALSLDRFVSGQEVFRYCSYDKPDCQGKFDSFLNKLSGSASLSLSSASTQMVKGTVAGSGGTSQSSAQTSASALIQNSASHLTGFTIRFQAINTLDLRSKTYLDAWKKAITDQSIGDLAETARSKFETAFSSFYNPAKEPEATWLGDAEESLRKLVLSGADDAALIQAVASSWSELIKGWPAGNNYADTLKQFLQAANAYMAARDLAVNKVRQTLASGLTFEYAYSRPNNQPRISTARVIYTLHPGTLTADTSSSSAQSSSPETKSAAPTSNTKPKNTNDSAITFNFAADLYDNPPPGTGTLRDLQAALQLDHHFGSAVATLAGYYQYQNQPAAIQIGTGNLAPNTNIVLPGAAATLLAPKGNIVVAQAMVTFALRSGSHLPVGVTWSNRTELVKGNEIRGHIGFNFDWSSLLLAGQAKAANPSVTQP